MFDSIRRVVSDSYRLANSIHKGVSYIDRVRSPPPPKIDVTRG